MKILLTALLVLFASIANAEEGKFGVEVDVSTKGLFPPKLEYVVVATVKENSAASKAGIVPGDNIISINGCEVPGCSAFKARKEMKKEVGESLDFVVRKSTGQEIKVNLVAE